MKAKKSQLIPIIALSVAFAGILIFSQPLAEIGTSITGRFAVTTNLTVNNLNNGIIVSVVDSFDNSAIENALVIISNSSNVELINGTSNSSGKFEVTNIVADNYTVVVNKTGYTSANKSAVVIHNLTTNVLADLSLIGRVTAVSTTGVRGPPAVRHILTEVAAKGKAEVLIVYQGETVDFVITLFNTGTAPITNTRLKISGFPQVPLEKKVVEETSPPPSRGKIPAFEIPVQNSSLAKSEQLYGITGALVLGSADEQSYNDAIFTITPEEIEAIAPGTKKSFFVEMRIPELTPMGHYDLLLNIKSNEVTYSSPLVLEVLPLETKPAALFFADEIEFLRRSIEELNEAVLSLKEKGGDVSDTLRFLKFAGNSLDKAAEFRAQEDYESMIIQIETAKNFIREAVEILSKVRIVYIDVLQTVIFVSISIFAVLIAIIFYLRSEQKKTYTLLKELLKSSQNT